MSFNCLVCSDILTTLRDTSISTRNCVIVTKCGHLYHNMCIRQWLLQSKNRLKCPACQFHLDAIEFTRVDDIEDYKRKCVGREAQNSTKSASDLLKKLDANITKGDRLLEKADELLVEILDLLIDNSSTTAETDTLGGLKINDRVVWMGAGDFPNDACDFGHVRWLGKVNGSMIAGVEFDDPSGNTNGELNGRQYFSCHPKHGRFLFVRELFLYDKLFCEK